jgi:hypothetical protein
MISSVGQKASECPKNLKEAQIMFYKSSTTIPQQCVVTFSYQFTEA